MDTKKTLWVITAEPTPDRVMRGGGIGRGSEGSGARAIDVDKLQANLKGFLGAVQEMLAVEPPSAGNFHLEEVEVSAEITAEGSLMILGTGARASGTGGIRFLLKRK